MAENYLTDWLQNARSLEESLRKAVIGQDRAIHLLIIAIFARGHVLLEGDVGVGKTTLLRAVARALGGAYERVEGSVDMMPTDLIYYTYIGEDGKPKVDSGPLLKNGNTLSTFFFNEINRARPQVHSLMLRAMAERSITAFNKEYFLPHLQVFADRNRIEKEETFEISSAAKDRFLMEISIETPSDKSVQRELIFNKKFYDVDQLIKNVEDSIVPYGELNKVANVIQEAVRASETMQEYAIRLWSALRNPQTLGTKELDGMELEKLVESGASPRGMAMLIRAAKVNAWLDNRLDLIPEDLHGGLTETMSHRIVLYPNYEFQHKIIVDKLIEFCKERVPSP